MMNKRDDPPTTAIVEVGARIRALVAQLREKFDALLINEVKAYGGIPVFVGRCGKEQTELREAVAAMLETEAELDALLSAPVGSPPPLNQDQESDARLKDVPRVESPATASTNEPE